MQHALYGFSRGNRWTSQTDPVLHNYLPDSSNDGIYSSDSSVSLQLSTYLSPTTVS